MRLSDLLETNINQFGEYPFLYFKEKQYTNMETKMYAQQFAGGLRQLGIFEGENWAFYKKEERKW